MSKALFFGREDAPYVIVADAPAQLDFNQDEPCSTVLRDLIYDIIGQATEETISIDDVVIVSAMSTPKPRYRAWKTTEIRDDSDSILIPFIEAHPRIGVIAMGNLAIFATRLNDKLEGVVRLKMEKCYSKDSRISSIPMAVSIHPYFVMKTPDEAEDMLVDFRYAFNMFSGVEFSVTPTIIDLLTPSDVLGLIAKARATGIAAYDFETTGLNRDKDFPVSIAIALGEEDSLGNPIVYYWAGYDKLIPRYSREELDAFVAAFDAFFTAAETQFALVGWNINYDDWIAERWVGHDLPGSTYDGMILKWSVNNRGRKHGLKDAVTREYCIKDYEAPVATHVREVASRRIRPLEHEDDYRCLEILGIEPEAKAFGRKKEVAMVWPSGVDTKWGAYALAEPEELRLYNALDAYFTLKLVTKYFDGVEKAGLQHSCILRHMLNRELLRCEQRGMLLDVAVNRAFSVELHDIVNRCKLRITEEVAKIDPTIADFNPNSVAQLTKLLYGDAFPLPVINRQYFYEYFDEASVNDIVDAVESHVYRDMDSVVSAIKEDRFDSLVADSQLMAMLRQKVSASILNDLDALQFITTEDIWCKGIYAPIAFTKNGQPSCGRVVLETLFQEKETPILQLILMLRKASKLLSTYVDGLYEKIDENNILHPRYNGIGAETGRVSSYDPNGQNFNKYIRGQLIPRPGYTFVEFDLSAAEVRVVAAFSQDQGLIDIMNSGLDIHRQVASQIFNIPFEEVDDYTHRRFAKTIVFGLIYGMSSYALSLAINVTEEQAKQFTADFFERFPGLVKWLDNQVEIARTAPHKVSTAWGTSRSTRNMLSCDYKMVQHTARQAQNTPIQGTAAELTFYIIGNIMNRVRELGWDAHMVNTTHDSGTFEVPRHLAWYTEHVDENGVVSVTAEGPFVDLVREELARKVEIYPLNLVNFVGDVEVRDHWSAKPDLHKALGFKDDEGMMRWSLIKPEEILTPGEIGELEELEEVNAR